MTEEETLSLFPELKKVEYVTAAFDGALLYQVVSTEKLSDTKLTSVMHMAKSLGVGTHELKEFDAKVVVSESDGNSSPEEA